MTNEQPRNLQSEVNIFMPTSRRREAYRTWYFINCHQNACVQSVFICTV